MILIPPNIPHALRQYALTRHRELNKLHNKLNSLLKEIDPAFDLAHNYNIQKEEDEDIPQEEDEVDNELNVIQQTQFLDQSLPLLNQEQNLAFQTIK